MFRWRKDISKANVLCSKYRLRFFRSCSLLGFKVPLKSTVVLTLKTEIKPEYHLSIKWETGSVCDESLCKIIISETELAIAKRYRKRQKVLSLHSTADKVHRFFIPNWSHSMRRIFMTSNRSKAHTRPRIEPRLALLVSLTYFCVSMPKVFANQPNTPAAATTIKQSIPSAVGSSGATQHTPLTAGVDTKEQSQLSQNINQLLNSALSKKTVFTKSESAVSRYRAPKQKTWTKMKDASNFLVPWHGFGPSSEAGDLILNEKVKLKSLEAAEYARQRS